MKTLPQYIQDQARVFPLSVHDYAHLKSTLVQCGDGPELRTQWEKTRDGLGQWYPVKMHLQDIVVDREEGGPEFTEDYVYVRVVDGKIHTFAVSADKIERYQQVNPFEGRGRLEVILQL